MRERSVSESSGRLTVVTWNLNHWRQSQETRAEAWEYLAGPLAEQVDWDVALLQECAPPKDWTYPLSSSEIDGLGWGTAVTVRNGELRRVLLEDDSHPGCLVVADVEHGGLTSTVVSIYGRQEHTKEVDGEAFALPFSVSAVHRQLSDLTPVIDHRGRRRARTPLVIGGDLNVTTQLPRIDRVRHVGTLRRFAELGLTDGWTVSPDAVRAEDCDCDAAPDCGHVRTHTHNRSTRPWQLDYVFANAAAKFVSCRTVIDERTWQRSDHAPVVAVFEVG